MLLEELGLDELRKVAEVTIMLTLNAREVAVKKIRIKFRETIAYVAKDLEL
jgi:hypothetical protein